MTNRTDHLAPRSQLGRVTVSLAAAIGLTLLIFCAPTSARGLARQVVEGQVAASTPQPLEEGACLSGVQRRISAQTGDATNGVVGWAFEVDPKTWGGPFELALTGGSDDANLNITFYESLGTDDPSEVPMNYSYDGLAPGGEHGRVPRKMHAAVVCALSGDSATFRYTAAPRR